MSLITDKFLLCSPELRQNFKVKYSINTGGKAGKGQNKTRSFSLLRADSTIWSGYISYVPGDPVSEKKALARAHRWMEKRISSTSKIQELPAVSLTDEQRENLLCGALEGGSNYWYLFTDAACDNLDRFVKAKNVQHDGTFVQRLWKAVLAGHSIDVNDLTKPGRKLGVFSLESIRKGELAMIKEQITHFTDVLSGHDDAITADVWFQFCVLGELVFG